MAIGGEFTLATWPAVGIVTGFAAEYDVRNFCK
jgi:hypothetical protein